MRLTFMPNRLFHVVSVGAVLLFGAPAWAGSTSAGLNAYNQGDFARASSIFASLAQKGNADAQNHLGYLYAQGHGVELDYVRAHMWFNIAAASVELLAGNNRDGIVLKLTKLELKEARRLAKSCVQSRLKKC